MTFDEKEVRKITKATKEEITKLQAEYESMIGSVRKMSPAGLLLIALGGIAIILSFRSNIFDLIGLGMLLYPLYVFVQRGAHKKGYFEGYFALLQRVSDRSNDK